MSAVSRFRYRAGYERQEIREAIIEAEAAAREQRDMLLEHLGIIAAAVAEVTCDLHRLAQAISEMREEVRNQNKLASR